MTAITLLLSPTASAGEEEGTRVLERKDVKEQYRWNLESTYPNADAWAKDMAVVEGQIVKLNALKGTVNDGPEALLKVLKLRDETQALLEKVYVYSSLTADQDTRANEGQTMRARAQSLAVNYGQAISWLDPALTEMSPDKLAEWANQNSDLALYRHYFDNLMRQKKHILSEQDEHLIAMAGEVFATPENAYNLLSNADLVGLYPTIEDSNGKKIELSDSVFYDLMRNTDRRVRRDAYYGIVGTYKKVRNASAMLLNGVVQNHVFTVRARGYDSCLQAALDGGNIPTEVYENLVNTVNDNLPLLHRYESIRKRALKLTDGVRAYDLFAPFVTDVRLEYSYEQGADLMRKALAPLGPQYLDPMGNGIHSRWIDVYPTKGKRSGAYSSGTFLTQPYILLNFHGGYDDVSTLAHEMGHSMHSYFSRHTQPFIYADYDIFCAEVASTTNEALLQNYVLGTIDDPSTKLYLLVEFLETFRGTVFRQTMFSEFEQRIHEMAEKGEPLTADSLSAAYGEIMKKYYGPDYTHEDIVDSYWIRIPHFYYNFYVYKYATSYCAAANIARRISEGEPGAVEKYLTFLKSGSHKYPIELLKGAGVDMTTPDYILDAMANFEKLLDETEALLDHHE